VRQPRLHGLAGAAIAIGVFAALLVFPATLEEGPRLMQPAERGVLACLAPACDPVEAAAVARIEAELASRMPAALAPQRSHLARTIVAEAMRARIDPLLVLALIQIESRFDPAALSERGARGLMQLREPTLRREVEHAGLDWESAADPAVNVQAGIRYLRRLLDAFGREEVALMAYNAGPNRILAYLREGTIPDRFHVYPRKVNAELRRLRRSLGPDASPALASARTPVLPE
jgi:soluble lytic murein transglycosylase-like protein